MDRDKETPETDETIEATDVAETAEADGATGSEKDAEPETPGETATDAADATGDEGAAADTDTDPAVEIASLKDQLLRALADTENLRRRAAKEREEVGKYAITGFARDLLSVVDNLRRALDSVPDEVRDDDKLSGLVAGIEMTEREFLSVLERHGIRRLDPHGEKFDHNYHQAMYEVESGDQPAGTIVEVMQAGYVIADRLLRPAMVAVAKGEKTKARLDTTA